MTWEVNESIDVTEEFLNMVIKGYEKGEPGECAIEWNETG